MKKVTILSLHLGYGGIEKAICTLANSLCPKYLVEIVCIYKLNENPSFELDKRVGLKYLIDSDLPVKVARYKELVFKRKFGTLFKELFRDYFRKFKILSFLKDGFSGIFMYPRRFFVTRRAIKRCDSDIIVSTRTFLNKWLGRYGKKDGVKIGWEHNHYHGNMKYAREVALSVKNLNYLVLVSLGLKNFYEEMLKGEMCRCVYIPNSLDSVPLKPSNLSSKRMISVGRLSKEKGCEDLIQVFNKFKSFDDEWTLDIVGDGVLRENVEELILKYNLEDRVFMHGFRDKKYINDLLSKSSIYLMCSYTESFGIVLIEAMSYGIPCVAFDSAEGALDIITDCENGFLISNRDYDEMALKMKFLASDYDLRRKMGKKALETSLKYTSDVAFLKWQGLFEGGDDNG